VPRAAEPRVLAVHAHPAYERSLEAAVDVLLELGAVDAAQAVLDRAAGFLPELLLRYPEAGRQFDPRNLEGARVLALAARVRELLSDTIELREYVLDDYLVLYAIDDRAVHLLTLRHHRQDGFSLEP